MEDRQAWAARPWAALALRAAALVLPLGVAVAVTWSVSRLLPPTETVAGAAAWFVALAVLATIVIRLVERGARRLLPLASLLRLSLVFPGAAPSRAAIALRSGSERTLTERLERTRREGLPDDPDEAAETVLSLVAALSMHDHITRGHAERVRAFAKVIAEELGLPQDQVDRIQWAGLLHDIGKLIVPFEVLNKPGRLDPDEWEVMRRHPEAGMRMVAPLATWLGDEILAVSQHHERWDGRGYPHGLSGGDISLSARIVAVADAFDVITAARSYKRAMSVAQAQAEIARCAGTQFDEAVVRAFLAIPLARLRRLVGPLAWVAQLPVASSLVHAPAVGGPFAAAGATGVTAAAAIAPLALRAAFGGPVDPTSAVAGAAGADGPATVAVATNEPAASGATARFGLAGSDLDPVVAGGEDTGHETPPPETPGPAVTPAARDVVVAAGSGVEADAPAPVDEAPEADAAREATDAIVGVVDGAGDAVTDVADGADAIADVAVPGAVTDTVGGTLDAVDGAAGDAAGAVGGTADAAPGVTTPVPPSTATAPTAPSVSEPAPTGSTPVPAPTTPEPTEPLPPPPTLPGI